MRQRYTQESDFRQQRDFGQKITATFEFIGAHWQGLGRALLYIVLPTALLQGLVAGLLNRQMFTNGLVAGKTYGTGSGVTERLAMFNSLRQSPYYWVSVVLGAIFVTMLVLTVYGYMLRCLRPNPSNEPITVGEVWAVVRQQFLSSFFSYFGLIILVILASILLFFPGIYIGVAFTLFYVVKVVEGTGFGATCSRCLRLTRGKWWSTFGLGFIMSLMLGIVAAVVGGVAGALALGLGSVLGLYHAGDAGATIGLFTVVTSSLGGLLYLLIYPPLLVALAFQYFNLVERQDGVGLHNLVSQLGQAPVAVQNATYRPDEEGEY
ncbi:hypothetical protein [Hymenobacter terricola]|uniref:hypothetical protein n=1 Tax=Hymenobacter terricola TaxID=2819236 RepID=UPI001B317F0B|nr:hypothetical protein [Hymenobacter terricola]